MQKTIQFLIVFIIAISVRILWYQQTQYTAEDAHITFQYSRSILRGDGFELIPGKPVYGTTTPLMTFIMAGWLFFSKDVAFGSHIIDLVFFSLGITFMFLSIPNHKVAILSCLIISTSFKLISQDMSGMEMPILFALMASSFFFYTQRKWEVSGVLSGLLLFTRIDYIIFPFILFFMIFSINKYFAFKFLFFCASIYLPWILFSWIYFGSPIPFTIIAKNIAYGNGLHNIVTHLKIITQYLHHLVLLVSLISICFLRRSSHFFYYYFVLNMLFIAISGSTFFDRYFYSITITAYILVSFVLVYLLERYYIFAIPVIFYISFNSMNIYQYKMAQQNRHIMLTAIGSWINEFTPRNSTVLLEPLGYIGWYADRQMLDEVGLVTPEVAWLKKDGIHGEYYYQYLHPDYILFSCHQGDGVMEDLMKKYELEMIFDNGHSRACYELYKKR